MTGGPGPSLVLLLLASLLLTGVLAYQAQDAARSHRAASRSVLRDYAVLARDELTRHLREETGELTDGMMDAALDADRRRDNDDRLVEFVDDVQDDLGPCECASALTGFFLVDGRSGEAHFGEAALSAEGREWIAGALRERIAAAPPVPAMERGRGRGRSSAASEPGSLPLDGPPGRTVLFTLVQEGDAPAEDGRAYGLVIDSDAWFGGTARALMQRFPLLPPSLTRGAPGERVLSLRLASGDRTLLRAGGEAAAEMQVADTLRSTLGSHVLEVAVRPEMAGRLVIGGLPRSRLPLLLGIFLLTLGLSISAVIQLRRQQALVRLRSGFVASVSHELRTPLAQIRLFSDLLASGRLGEEQRARSVRIIGDEAQRLAWLVENVLRFTRSGEGLERIHPEPTDLAVLTREVVDGFAPLAATRQARIATTLQPLSIAALDPDAIRQVLLNLLDNAVKYGPPGQTIRVEVAREGGRLRLVVDDEGPGIPPAERALIWEPYQRLRREVEAATGGSGIGLAVVRDLVLRHDGTVEVAESPTGGARFAIHLPARFTAPLPLTRLESEHRSEVA